MDIFVAIFYLNILAVFVSAQFYDLPLIKLTLTLFFVWTTLFIYRLVTLFKKCYKEKGKILKKKSKFIKTKDSAGPFKFENDFSIFPKDIDNIIIGSGVGGMASAALLSKSGRRVVVLEKNDRPGGCTSNYRAKNFDFDVGLDSVGYTFIEPRFGLCTLPGNEIQWRLCGTEED